MAKYIVRINSEQIEVSAKDSKEAKSKAARIYVKKYPKANLSTREVLTQYKIKARRI